MTRPQPATAGTANESSPTEVTIICAQGGSLGAALREAWRYRGLWATLVLRDLRVRYAQAAFGVAWAILQPLALLAVFTLVLGRGQPLAYAAVTVVGLVPWLLFSTGFSHGVNVLIDQERLLTKVYFPRLVLPAAALCAGLVDTVIVLALACVLLAATGQPPGIAAITTLVLIPMTLLVAAGPVMFLSALNVRYRDVRHALPLLTQVLLLASPIAWQPEHISAAWHEWLAWNPLWGLIGAWRWALLDEALVVADLVRGGLAALLLLLVGLWYFRRTERSFADVI